MHQTADRLKSKQVSNKLKLLSIPPGTFVLGTGELPVDLRPDQYNVVSAKRAKARHNLDVLQAVEGTAELHNLIDFFMQVKGQPNRKKGVVRVTV